MYILVYKLRNGCCTRVNVQDGYKSGKVGPTQLEHKYRQFHARCSRFWIPHSSLPSFISNLMQWGPSQANSQAISHSAFLRFILSHTAHTNRFPSGAEMFSSPQRPGCFWGPPSFLSNGNPGLYQRTRPEPDHSLSSSSEVKSYTSNPPYFFVMWWLI
jgi:hypothetical protein